MRVFTAGQGRKTDATDAHAIALAATRMTGLRPVTDDAQPKCCGVLAGRRRALGEDHTRMICQLHQLLADRQQNVTTLAGLECCRSPTLSPPIARAAAKCAARKTSSSGSPVGAFRSQRGRSGRFSTASAQGRDLSEPAGEDADMQADDAAARAAQRDLVRRGYDAISVAYGSDDGQAAACSAEDVSCYTGWATELANLLHGRRPGVRHRPADDPHTDRAPAAGHRR
jgi:hypothetical protein